MERENIISSLEKELETIKTKNDLLNVKALYLGKSGIVTNLSLKMKEIPNEEKKAYGKFLNDIKQEVLEKFDCLMKEIEKRQLQEKLEKESVDITLPATKVKVGAPNILEKVIEEVEELMMSMGYDVVDGPEIEEDHFNFELLNIPKGHPARDAQDTFYLEDDKILLRSQTSPVQARVMLEGKGEKPIRVICPGKTYRRDDDDATHSHQFMQIEGLLVDKDISLCDLKGTFDEIAKNYLEKIQKQDLDQVIINLLSHLLKWI